MTGDTESEYASAFDDLLAKEGLADPQVWAQVEAFDEVPLYSRLSRISFLGDLPIVEQNRQLIKAAVRYLDRVVDFFLSPAEEEDGQILRLVSITGWWVDNDQGGGICTDGTTEIIKPHLWIGNVGDVRMKNFRLYQPRSYCAAFVAGIVDLARHVVFESRLKGVELWCPNRVYIGRVEHIPAAFLS